jgi:hypothetical protein
MAMWLLLDHMQARLHAQGCGVSGWEEMLLVPLVEASWKSMPSELDLVLAHYSCCIIRCRQSHDRRQFCVRVASMISTKIMAPRSTRFHVAVDRLCIDNIVKILDSEDPEGFWT